MVIYADYEELLDFWVGRTVRVRSVGLDVYAYYDRWNRHLTKHPLDPDAEPYYDKMVGSIVKNAPGLKGLICVGESCGFPKRDGTGAGFNTFAPVLDDVEQVVPDSKPLILRAPSATGGNLIVR